MDVVYRTDKFVANSSFKGEQCLIDVHYEVVNYGFG